MSTELNQTPNKINVLAVIDTKYIQENYQNPSQDKNTPTPIDGNSQFIIASGATNIISESETSQLNLSAKPGDKVYFRGTSIYANSDDAVIVYKIALQGNHVFECIPECIPFQPNFVTRNSAACDPEQSNGLPPQHVSITSVSYEATVSRAGTENFYAYIALYTLDQDGNTQNLFGYFSWHLAITVSNESGG